MAGGEPHRQRHHSRAWTRVIACQASQIALPRTSSPLFRYLEDSVVEVNEKARRRDGVFHPKVWLLRYVAPGEAPFYRLLCLTRNLTFDRSWDLVLRLEGQVTQGRQQAYGRNNALGAFVQALPVLAVAGDRIDERIKEHVCRLQCEVRRVAFQTPPGFDEHLAAADIRISMDGRGRALDNVFVERLWRTVKYENVYLMDYASVPELSAGLTHYFRFYDYDRPHQSLSYRTPAEVYYAS